MLRYLETCHTVTEVFFTNCNEFRNLLKHSQSVWCMFSINTKTKKWSCENLCYKIAQFWYINIQLQTIDLARGSGELTIEFVGFIPQSLMVMFIVLSSILKYQNWPIKIMLSRPPSQFCDFVFFYLMNFCWVWEWYFKQKHPKCAFCPVQLNGCFTSSFFFMI